jgi:hypothetical protein
MVAAWVATKVNGHRGWRVADRRSSAPIVTVVAAGPLVTGSEATMSDDKKTELAGRSDELLNALQRLKDTEQRKRHEPISSETFHELANEVDALSHEVFSIARDQRDIGDDTEPSDETIEDVDANRNPR